MIRLLRLQFVEVLQAVAPLVAVVTAFQLVFDGVPLSLFVRFLVGAALAVLGMMLLFTGIDLGIVPMGRFIGAEMPRKGSLLLILAVGFGLGFATTAAEPDVLVLSDQVSLISDGTIGGGPLIVLVAAGVGLFTALGLLRVVRGFSIKVLLIGVYAGMLALSFAAPAALVPLAYDAGSVTTGVLTTPVVLALALGLSTVLSNRSAASDGFGLLGMASIGPIIAVLLMGILSR